MGGSFLTHNLYILFFLLIITLSGCYVSKTGDEISFDWRMAEGEKINIALNQHPYAYTIIEELSKFEEKTGIQVNYTISPEEYYADKITFTLLSNIGNPDVFMTGPYYIWVHASNGLVHSLDELISDQTMTNPHFDISDFHPTVLNNLKWNLVPGDPIGTGTTWALPIAFEINSLAYNKQVFTNFGLTPPETLSELSQLCNVLNILQDESSYPLGLRGTNKWTGITTGYITSFVNNGAKDFIMEDGILVSKINSKEAIEVTEQWVELVQNCVPPGWINYPWYSAGGDLGAGKISMLFDADINGYYQNVRGNSNESGNIAWTMAPLANENHELQSNIWTWGLAINESSLNKTASWLFIQYFTSKEFIKKSTIEKNLVNPPRQSVLNDPEFFNLVKESKGYYETLNKTLENANQLFTPHPLFFNISNEWSMTLQRIVLGEYKNTEEGLNNLKIKIDKIIEEHQYPK